MIITWTLEAVRETPFQSDYTELHVLCLSVSTSLWSCWHLRNCNQLIIDLISHNGKKFWSEWNDCNRKLLLSKQAAKNLFLLNLGSFYTAQISLMNSSAVHAWTAVVRSATFKLFVLILLLLVTHWLTKDELPVFFFSFLTPQNTLLWSHVPYHNLTNQKGRRLLFADDDRLFTATVCSSTGDQIFLAKHKTCILLHLRRVL